MTDNWIHKSESMLCKTCMFFVQRGIIGRCRERSPTLKGWPVMFPDDWCGAHKLDEQKLAALQATGTLQDCGDCAQRIVVRVIKER